MVIPTGAPTPVDGGGDRARHGDHEAHERHGHRQPEPDDRGGEVVERGVDLVADGLDRGQRGLLRGQGVAVGLGGDAAPVVVGADAVEGGEAGQPRHHPADLARPHGPGRPQRLGLPAWAISAASSRMASSNIRRSRASAVPELVAEHPGQHPERGFARGDDGVDRALRLAGGVAYRRERGLQIGRRERGRPSVDAPEPVEVAQLVGLVGGGRRAQGLGDGAEVLGLPRRADPRC